MMNQSLSHLTNELALKANVVETYARGTVDNNMAALQADTASNLALTYNKVEVFNTYEVKEFFTLTLADTTARLASKADITSVYTTTAKSTELDEKANQTTTNTKTEAAASLALKADITSVYTKTETTTELNKKANSATTNTKTEVAALISAYDPYTLESPLGKGRILATGEYQIRLNNSYYESLNDKADMWFLYDSITDLQTNTNDQLAAIPLHTYADLTLFYGSVTALQTYTNNQITYIPYTSQFWAAGKIHGGYPNIVVSKGRYGFTVSRPAGYAVGVYYINFNTAYPSADYVISTNSAYTGHCKVWDSQPPTAAGVHIVKFNVSNQLINTMFHFSVIA
jgi:hypothetical protein